MNLPKRLEILGGLIALAMGVYFGLFYATHNGAETFTTKQGALQLYAQETQLEVPLIKSRQISPDTLIYTFKLPNPELNLGLETGQHIIIHAFIPTKNHPEGEEVQRKYTPISRMNQTGTFDLLIKIYRAGVNPKFPDGGVMTQYLEKLKVGDTIKISGPRGKLTYYGNGQIRIEREDRKQKIQVKKIGLLAGGTGITPMYQLIRAVLENPSDETNIVLLFGNKSEQDILLREELEVATKDPRIKVYFTLDSAPAESGWKGYTGYVTKEMITQTMPQVGDDMLICTCGPGPFNKMLASYLLELGYNEDKFFKF